MLERVFGSLFVWQLTRDGRRAWPTVGRCVVAATAGIFLWSSVERVYPHQDYGWDRMQGLFRQFEATFTYPCLYAVFYVCVAVTPGLFAPLLARDRESRLLDLLLTTQLTHEQIVLGRWGVRFVQILSLFVSAVPIFILSYVYGGASILMLLGALAVSLCTAISLSAIATLVSASARTTREAFAAAYAVPVLLALIPEALYSFLAGSAYVGAVPAFVLDAAAFLYMLWNQYCSPTAQFAALLEPDLWFQRFNAASRFATFVIVHLVATLVMWRLAVRAIRTGGEDARLWWSRLRERLFRRKAWEFRESPILIREWRASPTGIWEIVQRHVFTAMATLGLYLPVYCVVFRPFKRLWWLFGNWQPEDYPPFYLWTGGLLFTFALIQVLQNAGNSIANERDRDTWQMLLATRLSAREIVRHKVFASLRPVAVMLVFWIPLMAILYWQGHADLASVVVPALAAPCFALFVAATSFCMTLEAERPWNGMLHATGVCGMVFALLASIQSATLAPSPQTFHGYDESRFVSRMVVDASHVNYGLVDGMWLLSSPFLVSASHTEVDSRWSAAVFALMLLGAGVAFLNLAEERFAARTGRSEHALSRPVSR